MEDKEWKQLMLSSVEKLSSRMDKIADNQLEQAKILTRNTVTVEEHHRRSTLLEDEFKIVKNDVEEVKEHVHNIQGMGKLFRWMGIVAGSLISLFGLIKLLGSI